MRKPTDRQIEILQLKASGLTDPAIAERLGISVHTAKAHLRNLYESIGAKTGPHAVALAYDHGFLPAPVRPVVHREVPDDETKWKRVGMTWKPATSTVRDLVGGATRA